MPRRVALGVTLVAHVVELVEANVLGHPLARVAVAALDPDLGLLALVLDLPAVAGEGCEEIVSMTSRNASEGERCLPLGTTFL